MGVFDTIGNFLGTNLDSLAKKAAALFVLGVVIAVVLSLVDPALDAFLTEALGRDVNLPLTIPDMMEYFGYVWAQLSPIIAFSRDYAAYGMFFIAGIIASMVAILLGGDPDNPSQSALGIPKRLSKLAKFFNDQRDRFKRDR